MFGSHGNGSISLFFDLPPKQKEISPILEPTCCSSLSWFCGLLRCPFREPAYFEVSLRRHPLTSHCVPLSLSADPIVDLLDAALPRLLLWITDGRSYRLVTGQYRDGLIMKGHGWAGNCHCHRREPRGGLWGIGSRLCDLLRLGPRP
jgi:hypothetical protein